MIIAIDFDGTCVSHEFPKVGKDIGAVPVLRRLIDNGHKLILFTMRSHEQVDHMNDNGLPIDVLQDAIDWFKENDIPLFGINENTEQKSWTHSPKPYAHLYIDDAAFGCPLMTDTQISKRPFVNWNEIESAFEELGIIKKGE